jgi:hypothetical protein
MYLDMDINMKMNMDIDMNEIKNNNSEEIENIKAKLESEAKEYFKLSKEKRSSYSSNEDFIYIINRNWLAKWKKFVDYQYIKENSKSYINNYSFNKKEYVCDLSYFPGEINNDYLIIPKNEFLNDGDNSNIYNYVIRTNIDQRKDLKFINKKIWDFFYKIYQGGPELKKPFLQNKSNLYSSMKIVELFYRKVKK